MTPGRLTSTTHWQAEPRAGRALKRIKEQLRAVPDNGLGYGMLRYLDRDSVATLAQYAPPQIAFNYLGRFPMDGDADWQPSMDVAGLSDDAGSTLPLRSSDRARSRHP